MSSLEKDRQDLQSTIDALQEGIFMIRYGGFYCNVCSYAKIRRE